MTARLMGVMTGVATWGRPTVATSFIMLRQSTGFAASMASWTATDILAPKLTEIAIAPWPWEKERPLAALASVGPKLEALGP